MLRNPIFVIFQGGGGVGSGPLVAPSGSAHEGQGQKHFNFVNMASNANILDVSDSVVSGHRQFIEVSWHGKQTLFVCLCCG